jgi:hypothetical protein
VSLDERSGPLRYAGQPSALSRGDSTSLADLLERILDKGIVIAGDISISLVDVELLTIKLRLLIASVDKAQEIGVNWWQTDPWLSGQARPQDQVEQGDGDRSPRVRNRPVRGQEPADQTAITERLDRLEAALERWSGQVSDASS